MMCIKIQLRNVRNFPQQNITNVENLGRELFPE